MIYFDTETAGLTGPAVLIQYKKEEDTETTLHQVWKVSVRETLNLIEELMDNHLCGYNVSFDSFQLAKLYNTSSQLDLDNPPNKEEYFKAEKEAWKGLCLRPKKVTDLYLLLKDTALQFINKRKSISIIKVPVKGADWIKKELEKLELPEILFAGYSNKSKGDYWDVSPHPDKNFVNFKLNFKPSIKLKAVCNWLFGIQTIEYNVPEQYQINDKKSSFNPVNKQWIKVIDKHIEWWDGQGKEYAVQDIILLELLCKWFEGLIPGKISPKEIINVSESRVLNSRDIFPYDEDSNGERFHINSELAWQVGVSRQKGYSLDLPKINSKLEELRKNRLQINVDAPAAVMKWLKDVASPAEKMLIKSTDKKVLAAITSLDSEVSERAKLVLAQRHKNELIEVLEKLQSVGRFHPDFNTIGTFSNRMSGSGGINAQGIDKQIRDIFLFNSESETVSGGDFEKQELSIAAEVYEDDALRDDLANKLDIHRIAGSFLYSTTCKQCRGIGCKNCNEIGLIPKKEEEVTDEERYVGKNKFVFPVVYGAIEETIQFYTGKPIEKVKKVFQLFYNRYKGAKRYREEISERFCSMKQPKGIGTEVVWSDPEESIDGMFGHRRFFTVENMICKHIFEIARKVPKMEGRCERREGKDQTIHGACSSALYAASFAIQSKNLKAAANHKIQATGAFCTKFLQHCLWDLQHKGINNWRLQLFNVHDEIICPNSSPKLVEQTVIDSINILQETIPLLSMVWKTGLKNWSEK